ncbi:hypothetical protein [Nonlabens ponticola]|uniref:Uncharacterized protein n=1 Tax=Nonlabens ponticola TaxID=2496866 RepID=A0A3S9MXN5_9FLAO|nr:hypothetical protein [Nonlabens ponticola]AZQ43904.1 hypothetical protein EJ995_06540 [Nonlabens ponticola]
MKTLILLTIISVAFMTSATAQTEFELEPTQSMIMTGKGPGQDATINPYTGQDCIAVIENIGKREFSIRIQKQGKVIKTIAVKKGKTKKINLLKDQELYLDTQVKTRARVSYEALEK